MTGEDWDSIASRGFDPPQRFAAYLNTLRWNCVTSTDPNLLQSPFRAGIRLDPYQLEPLRKAHLRRWWDRTESRSSEGTSAFLEELLLEWVLYRHLRVATRKLANQGVSTFKYRPEEGRLLLVAERLPVPTYTAPRVKQGFRVAEDIHCIRRTTAGAELSEIGKAILEAHHV